MGRQCPEVPGIALMKERPKKKKKSGKWNAKIEAIFAIFKWKSQISCDMVPHY